MQIHYCYQSICSFAEAVDGPRFIFSYKIGVSMGSDPFPKSRQYFSVFPFHARENILQRLLKNLLFPGSRTKFLAIPASRQTNFPVFPCVFFDNPVSRLLKKPDPASRLDPIDTHIVETFISKILRSLSHVL